VQRIYLVIFFLCWNLWPALHAQQKSSTKFKAGLEAGGISTESSGNGLLIRSFLKLSYQQKFSQSLFKINSRLNPEILNTNELISGYKLFLQVEYLLAQSPRNSIYFSVTGKNQIHFLEESSGQVFNELESNIVLSHKLSSAFSSDLQHSFLFRKINATQESMFKKNNIESSLSFYASKFNTFKIGGFWEYLHFNYLKKSSTYNNRIGPLFEYSFNNNMIFKVNYKPGFDVKNQNDSQWISIIGGKYLSAKISLFVFLYYLWQENDQHKTADLIFYQLESFNNFTAKIAYDLSEVDNIYFKIVNESQEIFRNGQILTYWQGIIGIQKTF